MRRTLFTLFLVITLFSLTELVEMPHTTSRFIDAKLRLRGHTVIFHDWFSPTHRAAPSNMLDVTLARMVSQPKGYEIQIRRPELFQTWITAQANRKDLRTRLEITSPQTPSPKQAAELAALIVDDRLSYDPQTASKLKSPDFMKRLTAGYGNAALDQSDLKSVDEILLGTGSTVCRHYALCVTAVYNGLKKAYPALVGSYLPTEDSNELNHAWNALILVSKEGDCDISFLDPTSADQDWKQRSPTGLDFRQFLLGLHDRGLLTIKEFEDTSFARATSGKATVHELYEYLEYIWLSNEPNRLVRYSTVAKIFLKKAREIPSLTPDQSEFIQTLHKRSKLQ
jgi:hypothetical protein